MSTEGGVAEIRREAASSQGRITLAYALILAGLMVEMAALAIGAGLGVSTGEYLGTTKAVRDGVAAESGLLSQGGTIAAVSAWLEPLKFVGLALFFTGIGVVLSAIIPRIKLRAYTLVTVIPILKQR